ncbi:MAG TPA: hypothetical protein VFF68_02635 [Anaerolineaceae bacterium]|nr:hypothetical protein [Anaerolineaceae bacterium]
MTEPHKITAQDIELALKGFFDYRRNFLVPNVYGGFRYLNYEIDVLVVTSSRYAYDIEIKVSPGDLRRDAKKDKWRYCRQQHYFRKSYFAFPEAMLKYQDLVPEHAGIITVTYNERRFWFEAHEVRKPMVDGLAKKVTDTEYMQLGRLAMLRMWDLKHGLWDRRNAQQQAMA